jgi:acyl carrier protein
VHQHDASRLSEIELWLHNWFLNHNNGLQSLSGDDNYIEKGGIDSFEIINLIEDVEGNFKFKFGNRDFQDRRFVTIAGLAEIVLERLQ